MLLTNILVALQVLHCYHASAIPVSHSKNLVKRMGHVNLAEEVSPTTQDLEVLVHGEPTVESEKLTLSEHKELQNEALHGLDEDVESNTLLKEKITRTMNKDELEQIPNTLQVLNWKLIQVLKDFPKDSSLSSITKDQFEKMRKNFELMHEELIEKTETLQQELKSMKDTEVLNGALHVLYADLKNIKPMIQETPEITSLQNNNIFKEYLDSFQTIMQKCIDAMKESPKEGKKSENIELQKEELHGLDAVGVEIKNPLSQTDTKTHVLKNEEKLDN